VQTVELTQYMQKLDDLSYAKELIYKHYVRLLVSPKFWSNFSWWKTL